MSKKHDELFSVSHFLLMDEALTLVKSGGPTPLFCYYLGTLPFVTALLFFWNDMSYSSFAADHAVWSSLLMGLLFCWMKGWQAVYGRILYDVRLGVEPRFVGPAEFLRICGRQATVQPWGIFAFLLCVPLMFLPFPWVNSFFQNHTVLGGVVDGNNLSRRSLELAGREKWQNYILIWILSPWPLFLILFMSFGLAALVISFSGTLGLNSELFGDLPWFVIGVLFIVAGIWPASPLGTVIGANILLVLMALPYLINAITGVETIMLRSGYYWLANTTSLLGIGCGVYLLLDPLLKAAYTLRCFYGRSLKSGADLLVDLRPYTTTLLAVVLFFGTFAPLPLGAEPVSGKRSAVSGPVLDQAISEVLQQPEFAWRLPREKVTKDNKGNSSGLLARLFSPLAGFFSGIGTWLGDIVKATIDSLSKNLGSLFDWLELLFDREKDESSEFDFKDISRPMAYVLIGGISVLLLVLLVKSLLRRRNVVEVTPEPVQTVPDLSAEETTADQLAEDQWLALASEMLEKNELRLALRALFFSSLAFLERQRLIVITPFKTNRDYLRELSRNSHAIGDLRKPFSENITLFEKSWYGNHHLSNDTLTRVDENSKLMRSCCG